MRELRKLLLGIVVAAALIGLLWVAADRYKDSVRPPSMAGEAMVRGAQNRWRGFLIIKRPTLIEISRTDQICKDGLCSHADGIPLPRLDLKTILQDPAHSHSLEAAPGPYRALLARTCSHSSDVQFCSKTFAPGFRFAACRVDWELQLWTNGFGAPEDSDAPPPDFAGATGGYGFTAFVGGPDAAAACSSGGPFIAPLPEPGPAK